MKLVRSLSEAEAAYIAGIVDGEGTVTLTHLHRNEQRRLVVSVSNNERGLLEFIQHAVGAGRITNKPRNGKYTAPMQEARVEFEREFLGVSAQQRRLHNLQATGAALRDRK